jgi:hypothetical protein
VLSCSAFSNSPEQQQQQQQQQNRVNGRILMCHTNLESHKPRTQGEEEGTAEQQAGAPQPPNSAIAAAVAAAKEAAAARSSGKPSKVSKGTGWKYFVLNLSVGCKATTRAFPCYYGPSCCSGARGRNAQWRNLRC